MKRYFIVCFIASINNQILNCDSPISSNGFFSRANLIRSLTEKDKNLTNIVITNIIELTADDYLKYIME